MIRFLKSKIFLLLELTVLTFTVIAFVNISTKKKSIQAEITDLARQVEGVAQENQVLSDRLKRISSDSYRELQAKRSLNYQKPEETVFVFYEESLEKEEGFYKVAPEEESNKVSNPIAWWRYFFN